MKRPGRFLGIFVVAVLACLAGCEDDDDLVKGMDLKVVALRIPSQTSLTQGSSVTLTVLVKNNGTVLIFNKPFVTRIDFYENAALTVPSAWDSVEVSYPDDVTYPENHTDELYSDMTVAFEAKTVVDASNPPQLVFCRVTCDTENAVFEADEGNNTLVEICQVLPGTGGGGGGGGGDPDPTQGADPGISNINIPASVVRGNSLDVAVTVRNYGDTMAVGTAVVTVVVNEDPSLTAVSLPRTVSLAPDGTISFEFSLDIQADYPIGTAQLVASLAFTGENVNQENDEDTRTFEITVLPQPDLVVTSVTSSDTYASGTQGGLSVSFALKNEGDAEAYGSMAYVLICHETEGFNDAVLIGEKPVDALGPGVESGTYSVSCTYTAAANGNYKVYVKADGLGTVTESNEGNNAGKFDITFIHGVGAADLVVSIVYLSPAYDFSNPIDTIDVVYTVYNAGTGSSGPSWVGIVLTDQGGGQAQTWGPFAVPQLDSYGSYMEMRSLMPLPVAPLGGTPYVLTLTADLQDDVAESNEANNTISGTVLMY